MTKIEMVLQSRKFWAVVFVVVAALALYGLGQIDAAQLVSTLTIAASVYAGSVAVEDGFSAALITWVRDAIPIEDSQESLSWDDEDGYDGYDEDGYDGYDEDGVDEAEADAWADADDDDEHTPL